jgi:transketolase
VSLPVATRPFATALLEHGRAHPEVVVLTNDLTSSCEADLFAAEYPARHLSMGMAEQNLVASAAGLALEGLRPIYVSFAVFTSRRPYEQVALTIAYPALPVRIVGFLPGLTTPGGVTHQATDDIALFRQLPNLTVVEAADASDMRTVLEATYDVPGPVYIRGLRGQVTERFTSPLRIGTSRSVVDGDEVLVVVAGSLVDEADDAVATVRARTGREVGLVCVSTIRPFDDPVLLARIDRAGAVVTVENHLVGGGLSGAVMAHVARHGGPRVHTVGIHDTFTHGGTPAYLFRHYGLDRTGIETAILGVLGEAQIDTDQRSVVSDDGQHLRAAVSEGL